MEPITTELRKLMTYTVDGFDLTRAVVDADRAEFERLCDQIDAVHEGLERENDSLRIELARTIGELDEMHKSGEISNKPTTYMHSGMSITDELRSIVANYPFRDNRDFGLFEDIADRIDAEHQKALDKWKAEHGQMWLKGYAECHAELLEGNETLSSDLESCGWVRLPVDADGVPIRVGDELEGYGYPNGGAYCKAIVGEWGILAGEQECNYQWWLLWSADDVRHHHAPTVEEVLREFALAVCKDDALTIRKDVVDEYAAKLRLAGDAE